MRKKNRTKTLCSLILGLSIGMLAPLSFAVDDAKEYEIKAAYIFSLGSYITWPDTLFQGEDDSFTICVLGGNPNLVKTLNFIAPKRKINNRSVVIQALVKPEDGKICQILYIDSSLANNMQQIGAWHQKKPILLVSDMDRFIRRGGMIEFYMLNNKVRLAMDPETISDSGLRPSSQLMRVAKLRSR
jgi:hypothetical protein